MDDLSDADGRRLFYGFRDANSDHRLDANRLMPRVEVKRKLKKFAGRLVGALAA